MEDKRTEQYRQELKKFVMSHTEDVLKNPRSFIHYPFIDPGSVYDGNVWDWDTYWSVYGFLNLADSYQDPSVKPRIIEHAQGNIRNFFDHQLEDGYIPMMIEVADWPEPYLNMRHKEGKIMNMHKPFLCSQMCLISDYTGDYAWMEEFLPGVAKYFDCYDQYYFHENSGLYVWQDDIMIGMDNDPATFGRPPFSTANIYLNSFMCVELEVLSSRNAGTSVIVSSTQLMWILRQGNTTGSTRDWESSGRHCPSKYVYGLALFPCMQELPQKSRLQIW